MVVFHLPSSAADKVPDLEIGLVLSVWKGIKSPKVVASDCHVNSCMTFRAISLDLVGQAWQYSCREALSRSIKSEL